MLKASNANRRTAGLLLIVAWLALGAMQAQPQSPPEGAGNMARPVVLRVGVPNKQTDRDVVFPLIVETTGAASVGRIRAELELSQLQGWSFRGIESTRALDLRSKVGRRTEGPNKLVIAWDVSGEGRQLPDGHVALVRVQAEKPKTRDARPPADNPPLLTVRKMSWGLAEFEKQPDTLPQLDTPDSFNGNPDVSCFFFTH